MLKLVPLEPEPIYFRSRKQFESGTFDSTAPFTMLPSPSRYMFAVAASGAFSRNVEESLAAIGQLYRHEAAPAEIACLRVLLGL
jgi:hypothetical protein